MRCHVLVHPSTKVLRQSSIKEEEGESEDEEKEEEEEERSRRRGQGVEGRTLKSISFTQFHNHHSAFCSYEFDSSGSLW